MARGDAQDQHRRRAITRLTPAPIPEQRRLPCVAPSTTTFHTTRARGGEGHWTSILRYDSAEHLEAWMNAPERKALLSETREFIESEELMRLATAFPGWVPIDPLTGEGPPNWKTAMLVLLGLFPIVMLRENLPMDNNNPLSRRQFVAGAAAAAGGAFLGQTGRAEYPQSAPMNIDTLKRAARELLPRLANRISRNEFTGDCGTVSFPTAPRRSPGAPPMSRTSSPRFNLHKKTNRRWSSARAATTGVSRR